MDHDSDFHFLPKKFLGFSKLNFHIFGQFVILDETWQKLLIFMIFHSISANRLIFCQRGGGARILVKYSPVSSLKCVYLHLIIVGFLSKFTKKTRYLEWEILVKEESLHYH